MKIDGSIA